KLGQISGAAHSTAADLTQSFLDARKAVDDYSQAIAEADDPAALRGLLDKLKEAREAGQRGALEYGILVEKILGRLGQLGEAGNENIKSLAQQLRTAIGGAEALADLDRLRQSLSQAFTDGQIS